MLVINVLCVFLLTNIWLNIIIDQKMKDLMETYQIGNYVETTLNEKS